MGFAGAQESSLVAIHESLCENAAELYWLGYILTGDREKAIAVLQAAFNIAGEMSRSTRLPDVAARRAIIVSAVRRECQALRDAAVGLANRLSAEESIWAFTPPQPGIISHFKRSDLERGFAALHLFCRYSLILTVFEGLSIRQAAKLLNAHELVVRRARDLGLLTLVHHVLGSELPQDPVTTACSTVAEVAAESS
jgi:DNA-directed RNA polymerase specialized sigma24 family protein